MPSRLASRPSRRKPLNLPLPPPVRGRSRSIAIHRAGRAPLHLSYNRTPSLSCLLTHSLSSSISYCVYSIAQSRHQSLSLSLLHSICTKHTQSLVVTQDYRLVPMASLVYIDPQHHTLHTRIHLHTLTKQAPYYLSLQYKVTIYAFQPTISRSLDGDVEIERSIASSLSCSLLRSRAHHLALALRTSCSIVSISRSARGLSGYYTNTKRLIHTHTRWLTNSRPVSASDRRASKPMRSIHRSSIPKAASTTSGMASTSAIVPTSA